MDLVQNMGRPLSSGRSRRRIWDDTWENSPSGPEPHLGQLQTESSIAKPANDQTLPPLPVRLQPT